MQKNSFLIYVVSCSLPLGAIEVALQIPVSDPVDMCPYTLQTLQEYIEGESDHPRAVALVADDKSKKLGWADPEALAQDILTSQEFGKNRLTQNKLSQVDVVRFSFNNVLDGFFMRHSERKQYPREALVRFALEYAPTKSFEDYFAGNVKFDEKRYLALLGHLPYYVEERDTRIAHRAQLLLGILMSEMGSGDDNVHTMFSPAYIKKCRAEGCQLLQNIVEQGIDNVDPNIFVMASAQCSIAQLGVLSHLSSRDALNELTALQRTHGDRATVTIQKKLRAMITEVKQTMSSRSDNRNVNNLLEEFFASLSTSSSAR